MHATHRSSSEAPARASLQTVSSAPSIISPHTPLIADAGALDTGSGSRAGPSVALAAFEKEDVVGPRWRTDGHPGFLASERRLMTSPRMIEVGIPTVIPIERCLERWTR